MDKEERKSLEQRSKWGMIIGAVGAIANIPSGVSFSWVFFVPAIFFILSLSGAIVSRLAAKRLREKDGAPQKKSILSAAAQVNIALGLSISGGLYAVYIVYINLASAGII
ncbi:MAG: hypothetical protein ACOX88_04055 [Christensenellales bacterium]|jgi:hypothetical protein